MGKQRKKLMLMQMDAKLKAFNPLLEIQRPAGGWLNAVRETLGMTLKQWADKMETSAQNVSNLTEREVNGNITLNMLSRAGDALGLKLVYGFVSKDGSLDQLIENRATQLAREIVMRTSASMKLEDQENSLKRINQAIEEKKQEIKEELPKYLWH